MKNKNKKHLLLITIFEIIVCFIFLSSTTWSWFSSGINSSSNVINTSTFDISVTQNSEIIPNSIFMVEGNSEYGYAVTLNQQGTYSFDIAVKDTSTALNGYCKIVASNANSLTHNYFKTVVMQGEESDTLSFEIQTTEDNVTLVFIPLIGIPANESFIDNNILVIDFTEGQ